MISFQRISQFFLPSKLEIKLVLKDTLVEDVETLSFVIFKIKNSPNITSRVDKILKLTIVIKGIGKVSAI